MRTIKWNPGNHEIITDDIDKRKHEYRGMKIHQVKMGYEVEIGNKIKIPGYYTNLQLAARAIDREIGQRAAAKANRKPRKPRSV